MLLSDAALLSCLCVGGANALWLIWANFNLTYCCMTDSKQYFALLALKKLHKGNISFW
jgi:hypothetical protein